jgi:hypothetical protein
MPIRAFTVSLALASITCTAIPAAAQFGRPSAVLPAERYHIEVAGALWRPTPELLVSSESLGIAGTTIDGVADLGFARSRFGELRVVARAARKHKFRVHYLPIDYAAATTVERTFVFNGTIYRAGIPVDSAFAWKTWRLGYEYDFVSRERGYVGVIAEVKHTDVKLAVAAPLLAEEARARVPVPAIGGIVRVYPAEAVSITGEVTGMNLPGSLTQDDDTAKYLDWDLYVTVNVGRHAGLQVGYRSIDLQYLADEDRGRLTHKGAYVGGVVRF